MLNMRSGNQMIKVSTEVLCIILCISLENQENIVDDKTK